MNEKDYYINIRQWARDRNLIEGSTPAAQFTKLVEEMGELSDDPLGGIGDSLVVMCIICAMKNIKLEDLMAVEFDDKSTFPLKALGYLAADIARNRDITQSMMNLKYTMHNYCWFYRVKVVDALAQAWNEIKDRKGKMINGTFVKSEDLDEKTQEV